jgi:hypothetical protein
LRRNWIKRDKVFIDPILTGNQVVFMAQCPFCKGEITLETVTTETKGLGFIKQEIMYACPHCKSVLGISRGKWSG